MRPGLEVAVIADDLTGAADTGVQLGAIGSPVYLLPVETLSRERPWMATAAGASVYTASRQLSPQAAAERLRLVTEALPRLSPRWIYKKIDSCLRGNLGVEIDVLLDALGLDAALVAPALPAQGRTTIGGIHRVHGTPLVETEFARDSFAPVACSAVADVLAGQSRYPIGRIDMKEYGDAGRLRRLVRRERERGCRLIVCDAAEQTHLDQVAALVVEGAGRLLPVGSAGLAASLAGRLGQGGENPAIISAPDRNADGASPFGHAPYNEPSAPERRNFEGGSAVRSGHRYRDFGPGVQGVGAICTPPSAPGVGRLLLVCGTGSRVTRRQIDALLNRHPGARHELDPEWLLEASNEDHRSCVSVLLESWSGGILALGIRPLSPSGPTVTPGQARKGLAVFAGLAAEVLRASRTNGLYLFLSGGDTAEAFVRVSGGEAIALEQEVLPGLVLGRWLGGVADGLSVITKAGAFGGEQTLVALYERLSKGAGS